MHYSDRAAAPFNSLPATGSAAQPMSTEPFSVFRNRPRPRLFEVPGQLSAHAVWFATALIAAALAYYHWRYEGWRETIIFASAITTGLVAALTLLTRR
ncbi:MAG: hypothetical protein ABL893_14985, partial [Hyphomicrobium sp.]